MLVNGCGVVIRACAVIGFCALSSQAWAQRETGPYGDLFAGQSAGQLAGEGGETFSLRWSAFGGYDDVVRDQTQQQLPAGSDPYSSSGAFGQLSGTMAYTKRTRTNGVSVYGSTSGRLYSSTRDFSMPSFSGGTSFSSAIGGRTSFRGSFLASYAPYYQLAPYVSAGGDTDPLSFGFAVASRRTLGVGTDFGVSRRLSSRSTLLLDGGWQHSQFESGATASESRTARIRFTQSLAKGLGVRAGYGYQDFRFTSAPTAGPTTSPTATTALHNVDVGIDFNRPLSISRRTILSVGTGSSIAQSPGLKSEFHLTGQATLSQGIGRTWMASAQYNRTSYFYQGFRDLMFLDAFGANLEGQLGARVQLSSAANYSFGTVGLGATAPRIGTYTGYTRLSLAISRRTALSAQYLLYHYNAPLIATTVPGIPPQLNRQSFMIGLSGWVPFINKKGKP